MKTYRTASSNEGLRLPHHGYIVGKLAEALRLKGLVKDDLPGVTGKTVQRYFAGERVEPETVDAVIRTLVDGLVPPGIRIPDEVAENLALHTVVSGQLFRTISRWENLAGKVNSNLFPVSRPEDLPVPVLRFVALDFGMRWGAWVSIQDLRYGIKPDWDDHPLQSDTLRRFIDKYRGKTSVEKLAQDVHVSTQTVEEWRGGGSLPTDKHIRDLAGALANTPVERATLGMLLRLRVAAADILGALTKLCGDERINDMVEAFVLTAQRVHWFETFVISDEARRRLPLDVIAKHHDFIARMPDLVMCQAWNILIYGAACPEGEFLVRKFLVKDSEHRPNVAADFVALTGDWVERVRYWMQYLGSVADGAAFLSHKFGESLGPLNMAPEAFVTAALEGQMNMAGFDWRPGSDWKWFEVELPPDGKAANRAGQADMAASVGDLNGAVEHLRHAVKHMPLDPALHFKLGTTLWQNGQRDGRLQMVEEGLAECQITVQLDPEFGNARNEIAVILSNMGRYGEAEAAYAEAEPYHGSHAHHWYGRGLNYLALRRYSAAASSFRKAISLSTNGDHIQAKFWLAATLMAIGDTKAAKELGKKVHHLTGEDPTNKWQERIEGWTRMGIRNREFDA